ncbi:unnamed protein product, partial [Lymnaea stagnalis]
SSPTATGLKGISYTVCTNCVIHYNLIRMAQDKTHVELPKTWPIVDALKSDEVTFVDEQDKSFLQNFENSKSENSRVYPMKHTVRGNVLVINNETFVQLKKRKGTEKDSQKIRAVFSQLGFNVIVYNNLTCGEMQRHLMRESKQDYSNHDCFILFIMSHGGKGVVFGTDGNITEKSNSLSISFIKTLFSENTSLLGKPKLFFIQACQGNNKDLGQTMDGVPSTVSQFNMIASTNHFEQSDSPHSDPVQTSDDMSDGEETDGPTSSKADVFVSTATVEDFVSWRHAEQGSWYIQAIGFVFRKFACKEHLTDLMLMVQDLVSKAETEEHFKQVSQKQDTLRKKLFFFPFFHKPYGEVTYRYQLKQKQTQTDEERSPSICLKLVTLKEHCDHEQFSKTSMEKELENLGRECEQEKEQRNTIEKKLKSRDEKIDSLAKSLQSEKASKQTLEDCLGIII